MHARKHYCDLCTQVLDRVVGHQLINSNNIVHVAGTGMMHSSRLLILLVVAIAVASLGTARAEDEEYYKIYRNYTCSTENDTDIDSPYGYGKNLAELLSTLSTPDPATVDNWWFRSRTVGTGPDQVSGLAMCYAYSKPERCLKCLTEVKIFEYDGAGGGCFHSRNVSFLTSDGCIIRFADAPFFGSASTDASGARIVLRSDMFAVDAAVMREARRGLLSQLAERAGADALRFATGSQGYADAVIGLRHVMYGMAQCTRDLPLSECTSCLLDHLAAMYRDVDVTNSTSASVMGLSCYLSYRLDKPIHIAGMAPAPSPAPTQPPTGSSAPSLPVDRTTTLLAALAAAAGAVTLLNVGV